MAEPFDWILAAAALVATGVTVFPRTGAKGSRITQAMGFLLLSVLASLIWLRLSSVDVALAEAALGGGMLGAVLVYVAAADRQNQSSTSGAPAWRRRTSWVGPAVGIMAGAALVVVLAAVWLRVEQTMPGWEAPLRAELPVGEPPVGEVTHGVTGVLLAFRAYDTLLESAVLMIAGLAALTVRDDATSLTRPAVGASASARTGESAGVTAPSLSANTSGLVWFVRLIAPVLLLAGLWLLFAGSTDSGGAFQSGAVLAAMLILLRVAGLTPRWLGPGGHQRWLRTALVAGVVVFILAGLVGPLLGQPWLSWDPQWAFAAILAVEILLTAGIAAGLYAIFLSLDTAEQVSQR